MNVRALLLTTSLLALVVAVPGTALAYGDPTIDQGRFFSNADGNEIFSNEWNSRQGNVPYLVAGNGPRGAEDVALAAANCQLVVAVDVHVAVIAASSALAVVSDEDEIVTTGGGMRLPFNPRGLFDEEIADADCDTSVGPVLIEVVTAAGWGEPAGFGSMGDAADALDGGRRSRYSNELIDQGPFRMRADLDDAFHNEWHAWQNVRNGAAAAANCQAVIAVHDSLLVAGVASADATYEDDDSLVVTEELSALDTNITIQREGDRDIFLDVQNDHNATDSCSQPIESITIFVRPETSTLPPAS